MPLVFKLAGGMLEWLKVGSRASARSSDEPAGVVKHPGSLLAQDADRLLEHQPRRKDIGLVAPAPFRNEYVSIS